MLVALSGLCPPCDPRKDHADGIAEFPASVDHASTQTDAELPSVSTLKPLPALVSSVCTQTDLEPMPTTSVWSLAPLPAASHYQSLPSASLAPAGLPTNSRYPAWNLPTNTMPPGGLPTNSMAPGLPTNSMAPGLPTNSIAPKSNDLAWLSSQPTIAAAPSMSLLHSAKHDSLPDRAQVYLEGEWRDIPESEFSQICKQLLNGKASFNIEARGQTYAIDVSGAEGATQTNTRTGKARKLRFLDSGDSETGSCTASPASSFVQAIQEEPTPTTTTTTIASAKATPEAMPAAAPKAKPKVKPKGKAKPKAKAKDKELPPEVARQQKLGPQSKRGEAPQFQLSVLEIFPHAQVCFNKLAENEVRLCDRFAVFYHSYSFAALIYEVQAAVGAVLFRFRSRFAPLPRLLMRDFKELPSATALLKKFDTTFAFGEQDHEPGYRAVALSAMCSLCSLGPEASPPVVFIAGYSQVDMSFRGVLENLLESCFVPKKRVNSLANEILALSERHGLDVSQFGGAKCPSGKSGHMLQIFIHRDVIDELVYASDPWGPLDKDRHPISTWLNGDSNTSWGQARIVCNPKYFMSARDVRMFVASADPTFHSSRDKFQEELTQLLGVILGDPSVREKAATGIYGGSLPSWWTSEDQREMAKRYGDKDDAVLTNYQT